MAAHSGVLPKISESLIDTYKLWLLHLQGRASWYGGPESFQSNFANRGPPPNYGFGNILYGSCGYFEQVQCTVLRWLGASDYSDSDHSSHSDHSCQLIRPSLACPKAEYTHNCTDSSDQFDAHLALD